VFGWAHVDAGLGNPAGTFADYALVMVTGSLLGVAFGWMFWKLGLEWAILAHFVYDLYVSMVLIPVYLLESAAAWVALVTGLLVAATLSGRYLRAYREARLNTASA
jgi:hypothetical protein